MEPSVVRHSLSVFRHLPLAQRWNPYSHTQYTSPGAMAAAPVAGPDGLFGPYRMCHPSAARIEASVSLVNP